MPIPCVVFDETGNTGQNLLDPDQPVFVLASVHMNLENINRLLSVATPPGAEEAKFNRLNQSTLGRKRLIRVLDDLVISSESIKIAVYHKRFMVTTKILDMLVEPLEHARGSDFYGEGQNLALANMLHSVIPTFCGAPNYALLQSAFIAMARKLGPDTIHSFYTQLDVTIADCKHADFRPHLYAIRQSRRYIDDLISVGDTTAVDPAIPSFVDLAAQWTYTLGTPFDVVHDASKPMKNLEQRLRKLMSRKDQKGVYSNRGITWQLPLLATGIEFKDSRSVKAIQIADLVAGAAAVVYRARARSERDRFADEITATRFGQLGVSPVWPSSAVTSDALGTRGWSGTPVLDHSIRLLAD